MKAIGGLFERIASRDNLGAALWVAARGKKDNPEVSRFIAAAESQLNDIVDQIRSGELQFDRYRCFAVRDTKSRVIHAPSFRDRVVHHAIIRQIGPVFEMGALYHSYACRRGKGQHAALAQLRQWIKRTDWYAKIDINKYYDSVDHSILMRLLARRFRERRLLDLFDKLLQSYQTQPGRGLPIGALTSQHLGNFYLDEFDRRLQACVPSPRYLRYLDDILVLGTREHIDSVRHHSQALLANLALRAKNGGEWNSVRYGVPYLGFVVYPDRLRVNRNGRKRLLRKMKALKKAYAAGAISEADYQAVVNSLFAHVCTADDANWRKRVLSLHDCSG
jgi:retron-type reverse transcriptase